MRGEEGVRRGRDERREGQCREGGRVRYITSGPAQLHKVVLPYCIWTQTSGWYAPMG